MAENSNTSAAPAATVQTEALQKDLFEGQGDRKAKRVRRTNEQIAADKKREEDERRAIVIEELRAQGLIKTPEDERDYTDENLSLYNRMRRMPENACKRIDSGPLEGFTDINPMARVKMLTSIFGNYGFGWKVEVLEKEILGTGDCQMASVRVALYVRIDGEWSAPSCGFGGSLFFRNGSHEYGVDDDCFKKAATDAFGTACKNFGMAADIFYSADANYETKYDSGRKRTGAPVSFDDRLKGAGAPISAPTPAAAAPSSPVPGKSPEEKPATVVRMTDLKAAGFSLAEGKGESAENGAKAPAIILTETHRSFNAIFTHLCSLKDKSEASLNNTRARYRTEKCVEIPDDLWEKMVKMATS